MIRESGLQANAKTHFSTELNYFNYLKQSPSSEQVSRIHLTIYALCLAFAVPVKLQRLPILGKTIVDYFLYQNEPTKTVYSIQFIFHRLTQWLLTLK